MDLGSSARIQPRILGEASGVSDLTRVLPEFTGVKHPGIASSIRRTGV